MSKSLSYFPIVGWACSNLVFALRLSIVSNQEFDLYEKLSVKLMKLYAEPSGLPWQCRTIYRTEINRGE